MSGKVAATRPRTIRRLSSEDATAASLARGPSVVVPPSALMAPADTHGIAASMELARLELEAMTDPYAGPDSPPDTSVTDKYAFAFDIDGVLIRGGRPIPEAVQAMKVLNGENEYGIKM